MIWYLDAVLAFSAWLWAGLLHELGHYYYFRWVLKRKVFITFGDFPGHGHLIIVGRPRDYKGHSADQRLGIYLSGIVTGFTPLILLAIYWPPWAFMIIIYLALGCRSDIKNITRLYK